MVIYGEILFLENALTGGFLLWMVKKLCGLELNGRKLFLGSILCGLYAFTLFQEDVSLWISMMEKLGFAFVLVRICFGHRRILLTVLVFYGISFLMGGLTMGLAGFLSVPAVSGNGSFYMDQMSYFHIISGCGATIACVRLLTELISDQRHQLQIKREVTIIYKGKKVHTQGFLDTGNLLMDPMTGLPVCIITREFYHKQFNAEILDEVQHQRSIAYTGANGFEETLAVIGPVELRIGNNREEHNHWAMLGIAGKGEGTYGYRDCRILLNGRFMELESGEIAG